MDNLSITLGQIFSETTSVVVASVPVAPEARFRKLLEQLGLQQSKLRKALDQRASAIAAGELPVGTGFPHGYELALESYPECIRSTATMQALFSDMSKADKERTFGEMPRLREPFWAKSATLVQESIIRKLFGWRLRRIPLLDVSVGSNCRHALKIGERYGIYLSGVLQHRYDDDSFEGALETGIVFPLCQLDIEKPLFKCGAIVIDASREEALTIFIGLASYHSDTGTDFLYRAVKLKDKEFPEGNQHYSPDFQSGNFAKITVRYEDLGHLAFRGHGEKLSWSEFYRAIQEAQARPFGVGPEKTIDQPKRRAIERQVEDRGAPAVSELDALAHQLLSINSQVKADSGPNIEVAIDTSAGVTEVEVSTLFKAGSTVGAQAEVTAGFEEYCTTGPARSVTNDFLRKVVALFMVMKNDVDPRNIANKVVVAGALLYFINPSDLVPDIIPALGFLDDIVVVGVALKVLGSAIDKYLVEADEWLKNKRNSGF